MNHLLIETNMHHEMDPEAKFVPRHELWRAARLQNKGGIMDEKAQQVWEECVSIKQSVSQGERLELDEDILVKALKVPDHPGRVRAMGYGVRKSDYFPRVPRKKPQHSQSKIDNMKKEMKILLARLEKLERNQKEPTVEVVSVPCNSVKDSHPPIIPEGVTPCVLYSNDPSYHMVGKGSVYNQLGVTLHNHPLPADHVRVGVEIVLEGNAPLPVPNEDAGLFVLDDALGTHVAWPIGLIDLNIKPPTKSKEDE